MKQLSQKLFLATFLVLCASTHLFAQLTGTKTIGTLGTYTSLELAVADLNTQGVGAGGVIFEFVDNGGSNYNENPIATISITTTTATAANPIVFRPSATITSASIVGNFGGILVSLISADYVTFDGRNAGIETNKNIIFTNTSTGSAVVIFSSGATNNNLTNVKIQSRNVLSTSGAVVFQGAAVSPNNNNVLNNCEISGDGTGFPANGVYANASAAAFNNNNNTVRNCLIYDYFLASGNTAGIFLNSSNSTWTLENNRFYQTATRTYTVPNPNYAIKIVTGSGYNISNNIIGYNDALGTSTGFTVMTSGVGITYVAIDVAAGIIATSNIKGNIIRNINLTTSSGTTAGIFRGIQVTSGNVNIGGTTAAEGNTIGNSTSAGNINISTTAMGAPALIVGINNLSTTTSIQNNNIGSLTGSGNSNTLYSMIGIQTTSGGVISGNFIGSSTIANSIFNNTLSAANIASLMYGIFVNAYIGGANLSITNNTVAGLFTGYLGNNTGALTRGIYTTGSMAGNLTITGNEIYNISTKGNTASTGFSGAVLGGIICNSAALVTVNNNKVYNLCHTNAGTGVSIYGIFPNISNTVANSVVGNLVYNLTSVSGVVGTSIYGLRMSLGNNNICANNVIRLGTGVTDGYTFYGIWDFATTTNYYYNTVYIGGTTSGTSLKTFAFANDGINTRTVQNNIFVNARASGTISVNKHYAATFATSGTLSSNYNIFYASGADGVGIGRGISTGTPVNYTTYKDYRVVYPALEANSAFGNPQLQDPTNATAPDLSLGILSPAFQNGIPVGAVTNDYANVARSATTPNIGAYETATTAQNATTDIFTPSITYPPLTSSYGIATGTRTLTATITDVGVGVPTSGANVPTLWYQNTSVGGAWQSVAGTLTSGTGNNGTWDFILDQNVLTLLAGQTVSYYVVAQDAAIVPNIWYNVLDAAVNHTSVSAQVAPPTTPNTYIISGVMMGTYNVPGQFPSLTKAGGIFQAINNCTIGGNIVVNITGNLDENGTFGLDTWADGVNNYTLLIQPNSATQRVISNSANVATGIVMIRINADVDNTIDGRFAGAGQFLLFRNTNTTANNTGGTISYTNTTAAKQSILQYVVVENNTNASLIGNVTVGAGTNNVNINNCRIGDATGGTPGITSNGIYVNAGTFHTFNVQNNEIYNFLNSGVAVTNIADACVISNNVFYYNFVSGFPTFTDVIVVTGGSSHTISGNKIGGTNATNTGVWNFPSNAQLRGIVLVSSGATANTLNNNTIQNITLSFNSTPRFQGIVATGTSMLTINNLTIDNIQMPTANTATVILDGVSLTTGNATISNSTFNNIGNGANHTGRLRIIDLANTSSYTISDCVFSNITSRSGTTGNAFVIGTAASANMVIERNTIRDIIVLNTGDFRCIFQTGPTATSIIRSNRIFRLTSTSGGLFGLYIFNGDVTTSHNQIAITNGAVTNPVTINGIFESTSGIKTGNHYFNTIYVGGTQSGGGSNSAAYLKGNSNTVNLRNNIFVNERTSTAGTGKHYAINATNVTNLSSNYNLLVTRQTADNPIGLNSATACITFAAWKTARPTDDINSWTAIANTFTDHSNIIVANLFVDLANGNLNIDASKNESWYANGKGIAIATYTADYGSSGVVRSGILANGGTDLGSDEFNTATNPIAPLITGTIGFNNTQTFDFAGRQLGGIIWGNVGTLPTSLDKVWYYSGNNPPNPTSGALYFNAYWQIDVTGGAGYTYDIVLRYDDALIGTIPPAVIGDGRLSKQPTGGASSTWFTYQIDSSMDTGNKFVSSANGILNSFSNFTVSLNVAPLPLTLLSFDAKRQNDTQIQLNWLTTNELNLNYFVVERSYDAKNFVEVANVSAENPTTSIKNYILSVDESKAVYFRLKFVHYQKNNVDDSYSKVIFVGNAEEKDAILVYPNPMNVSNLANVRFAVSKNLQNETVNLQMIDNQGKTVRNFVGTFAEIEKQIPQNVQNLASGVYIWRFVVDGKTVKTLKISVE